MNKVFELSNGIKIPSIGFGTWRMPNDEIGINAIINAIDKYGYRHIDTASRYENEACIGEAIKKCVTKREDIFITSKVWNSDRGYDRTIKAFQKSLKELQLDYLDLYLIHWPAAKHQFDNYEEINKDTWKALIDLYHDGLIRSIGVSNFLPHHLKPLLEMEVVPMINQIEFHPGYTQEECVSFCKTNNIQVEAWRPLGKGVLLDNDELIAISKKYHKSVAQLLIKWVLQNDVLPLVKTVTESRMKENLEVFDFEINSEDMATINKMKNVYETGQHPDSIDF